MAKEKRKRKSQGRLRETTTAAAEAAAAPNHSDSRSEKTTSAVYGTVLLSPISKLVHLMVYLPSIGQIFNWVQ